MLKLLFFATCDLYISFKTGKSEATIIYLEDNKSEQKENYSKDTV